MTSDRKMIAAGFGIATLGAVGAMFYIVGLSALYIGRFAAGVLALLGACVLAVAFFRLLGRYLDVLDARAGDDDSQENPGGLHERRP